MEFLPQIDGDSDGEIEEVKGEIDETNDFLNLNTLNYGKDKFEECMETIDCDKLNFIVNNRDIFEPLLRQDRRLKALEALNNGFDTDPFNMATKYLKKSRGGKVKVVYKQKRNAGRFHAIKSLSLQCLTRQIRQSICSDYYLDIDMKNCHPWLLRFVCEKMGFTCPILIKYCDDRDKFFKDNGMTKNDGKVVFLSVLNGGSAAYNEVKNPSPDLKTFYKTEIKNIHKLLSASFNKKYQKHKENRIANGKDRNHKASFMNVILCDIESKVLDVMWSVFRRCNDVVLCFDGIMMNKGGVYDYKACEEEIFKQLKVRIVLDVKPFEDAFDMSLYTIPTYHEAALDYYPDFRNIVGEETDIELVQEWQKNSLVLIENGGKSFFLTKNKAIDSLTKDERVYWKQVK
jgi:hypothetical protein